jgi:hypothetical protein
MFGWLKKLLGFSSEEEEPSDLYRPGERTIYRYFDGEREVVADPLPLYKRVMDVGPELDVDIRVARSPMRGNKEAFDSALRKIRVIFDLKPFRDAGEGKVEGLTELEAFALLDHFMRYSNSVKKNMNHSQISAEETSVPSEPSSAGSPPTSSSSASGSTGGAPSTASPEPSPTGSESPSETSPPSLTTTAP